MHSWEYCILSKVSSCGVTVSWKPRVHSQAVRTALPIQRKGRHRVHTEASSIHSKAAPSSELSAQGGAFFLLIQRHNTGQLWDNHACKGWCSWPWSKNPTAEWPPTHPFNPTLSQQQRKNGSWRELNSNTAQLTSSWDEIRIQTNLSFTPTNIYWTSKVQKIQAKPSVIFPNWVSFPLLPKTKTGRRYFFFQVALFSQISCSVIRSNMFWHVTKLDVKIRFR